MIAIGNISLSLLARYCCHFLSFYFPVYICISFRLFQLELAWASETYEVHAYFQFWKCSATALVLLLPSAYILLLFFFFFFFPSEFHHKVCWSTRSCSTGVVIIARLSLARVSRISHSDHFTLMFADVICSDSS